MRGPVVQGSGLMRSFGNSDFNYRLHTGFCSFDEADYLESVAADVKAYVSLVIAIRDFKHILSTLAQLKQVSWGVLHQ